METKKSREQEKTPFLDAYKAYLESDPVPFDVPGHKLGNFETDLSRKLSPCFSKYDANAPIGLDNLYHAKGVIKEAEDLAAKACHADHCLFSVNGTTGAILTRFRSTLHAKDKVIRPRNIHTSVVNGLILSGATPIFVNPFIDEELGVACQRRRDDLIKARDENKDAKAVFIINPTYFGVTSDLKKIVEEAHNRNRIVRCDEAHGSNFYFSSKLPVSARQAGADITARSRHKNSGSLTQTSLLLVKGKRIDRLEVKRAFARFSSTSPYHPLMASLDAARKERALHGKEILDRCLELSKYAREHLNKIPGIHVYDKDYIKKWNTTGVFDIDLTKLVIDVRGLGRFGYDVYKEIRKESNIQLELGEVSVVLAIVGPGTTKEHIDRLIQAFERLSKEHYKEGKKLSVLRYRYTYPIRRRIPRTAYDDPYKILPLKDAVGEISEETIRAYPPGIPIILPGEEISKDTITRINFYRREKGQILKDTKEGCIKVVVR